MTAISVIIPAYNAGSFLEDCIRSVQSQQLDDLEILVVDDGSTDQTAMLAEQMAKEDPRIRVLRQSNQGVSKARNAGLSQANGDYIAFLDADDWIDPAMYATLWNEALRTHADLSLCGTFMEREGGSTQVYRHPFPDGPMDRQSIEHTFLPSLLSGRNLQNGHFFLTVPWLGLYRKSLLEHHAIRFHEELVRNEDTLFNLEFASQCATISFLPMVLHHYRKSAGSATGKYCQGLRANHDASDPYWLRFRDLNPETRLGWYNRKFVSMSTEFKNLVSAGAPHAGHPLRLRYDFRECIESKWRSELLQDPDYHPQERYQSLIVALARRRQYLALAMLYTLRSRIDREAVSA